MGEQAGVDIQKDQCAEQFDDVGMVVPEKLKAQADVILSVRKWLDGEAPDSSENELLAHYAREVFEIGFGPRGVWRRPAVPHKDLKDAIAMAVGIVDANCDGDWAGADENEAFIAIGERACMRLHEFVGEQGVT